MCDPPIRVDHCHNTHEPLIEVLWDILRREIAPAVDMERQMRQYRRSAKAVEQDATFKHKRAALRVSAEHRPGCSPYASLCEAVCAHPTGRVAFIHLSTDKTRCRPFCAPLWQNMDCTSVCKEKNLTWGQKNCGFSDNSRCYP